MDVFMQNLQHSDWNLSWFSTASPPDATALILLNQGLQILPSQNDNISSTKIQVEFRDDDAGAVNYDQVEIEEIHYPDYSQVRLLFHISIERNESFRTVMSGDLSISTKVHHLKAIFALRNIHNALPAHFACNWKLESYRRIR
jgi:hypothetical protein